MTAPTGASLMVARAVAPGVLDGAASERPITVDQTNESVVVGERVVVKWLTPPVPEPYPAEATLAHLRDAGFDEMPEFYGTHVAHGMVEAVVTGFVPDAQDGWDWFVRDLTDALVAGDDSFAEPVAWARRAGQLAARMHVALTTPTSVDREPTARAGVHGELARGLALLDEALTVTVGPEGQRLRDRVDRLRSTIDSLAGVGTVVVQRIHGDLHAGQLLRAGDALFVNDFDGSPVAQAEERRARRSAMVDLASLVQSVDHVGRVVARRRPDDVAAIDRFIAAGTTACIDAYVAIRPISDDERVLLAALRVVQELHEYVYAARSLPRWLYVPDTALTAMFP